MQYSLILPQASCELHGKTCVSARGRRAKLCDYCISLVRDAAKLLWLTGHACVGSRVRSVSAGRSRLCPTPYAVYSHRLDVERHCTREHITSSGSIQEKYRG